MERVPYGKLKGFMAEYGIKNKEIADLIQVTETTFSQKINKKGQDFTAEQIRKICSTYNLDANIFFLQ